LGDASPDVRQAVATALTLIKAPLKTNSVGQSATSSPPPTSSTIVNTESHQISKAILTCPSSEPLRPGWPRGQATV